MSIVARERAYDEQQYARCEQEAAESPVPDFRAMWEELAAWHREQVARWDEAVNADADREPFS